MAAFSQSASRKTPNYICDAYRTNFRYLRRPAVLAHRTFCSTASFSNDKISTRSILLPQHRNRAVCRPLDGYISRARCMRRQYSEQTSPQAASSGFAALPHRRLISVSGPDAAKFLQGLLTNNVDPNSRSSFFAAFLNARGRILFGVFVWVCPKLVEETGHWACYIEVDENEMAAVKKHFRKHKLRSKVEIEDVDSEKVRVWASWGPGPEKINTAGLIATMTDPRAPDMRRYLANADVPTIVEGVEPMNVQEYHIQRYRNGIPEGQKEMPRDSAVPMAYNIDLSNGIDFNKGCYVGQELTIRTKHTGIIRKRILPIQIDRPSTSTPLPKYGTDIRQLEEGPEVRRPRAAGMFVAGIGDVGLAMGRLWSMTDIQVSPDEAGWKPGMEFGCDTEEGLIKVKPILHDWFVSKERELWDKNRLRLWGGHKKE